MRRWLLAATADSVGTDTDLRRGMVNDYASKLTKTASSVLDGEEFVVAIKCFPQR